MLVAMALDYLLSDALTFVDAPHLLRCVFDILYALREWPQFPQSRAAGAAIEEYLVLRFGHASLSDLETTAAAYSPYNSANKHSVESPLIQSFSPAFLQKFSSYRKAMRARHKSPATQQELTRVEQLLRKALTRSVSALQVSIFIARLLEQCLKKAAVEPQIPEENDDFLRRTAYVFDLGDSGKPAVMWLPFYGNADGQPRLDYRIRVSGFGLLAYALTLSLDRRFDFGARLSVCRLPECSRFFLAHSSGRGGRLRRRYCCADHMGKMHKRGASQRVAKWRQRRRAQA